MSFWYSGHGGALMKGSEEARKLVDTWEDSGFGGESSADLMIEDRGEDMFVEFDWHGYSSSRVQQEMDEFFTSLEPYLLEGLVLEYEQEERGLLFFGSEEQRFAKKVKVISDKVLQMFEDYELTEEMRKSVLTILST